MTVLNMKVEGMHCKGCKMLVEEELEDAGATNISIEVDEKARLGTVSCEADNREKIVKAINDLGEFKVL